jgi:hypothetical protein
MKLKLKNVRLSFPNLFVAKAGDQPGSVPKFSAGLLLEPTDPQVEEIKKAMSEVGRHL